MYLWHWGSAPPLAKAFSTSFRTRPESVVLTIIHFAPLNKVRDTQRFAEGQFRPAAYARELEHYDAFQSIVI
jgi:hypothetical protein